MSIGKINRIRRVRSRRYKFIIRKSTIKEQNKSIPKSLSSTTTLLDRQVPLPKKARHATQHFSSQPDLKVAPMLEIKVYNAKQS